MINKPIIGLVTVLYNSNDVLDGFLRSLSIQTFKNYHLYLIDNTPSKETDELIDDLCTQYPISVYTHIKNTENVGVAEANNQGIELSRINKTQYTLLLNNDIEIESECFLETLYNIAEQRGEYLVIPKILYFDNRKIWMAGGKLLKWRGANKHIGTGGNEYTHNKSKYFNYAPTCFMLINNEVFQKVGMMDRNYFVYFDDLDFVWRASKLGYKIFYVPSLIVLHKVSSSTGGEESLFTLYYSSRNMVYFIRKNYKGMSFTIAISYTLGRRFLKYLFSSKEKKNKILKGLKDGFNISV